MRASALVAALACGLAALVACDAGLSNPFASFEARCTALPATRFDIVAVPVRYAEDDTQSIDQLTLKSGKTPATHMTFGLTTANFGHRSEIEIHSLEDKAGGRACGTLQVRVEVSMRPMTVYLAHEIGISRCARTATFEHEMKHVAVFEAVLAEAARDLDAGIGARVGTGTQYAASRAELESRQNAAVAAYLSQFMADYQRVLHERQDAVDSPEEHARVKGACPS